METILYCQAGILSSFMLSGLNSQYTFLKQKKEKLSYLNMFLAQLLAKH